MKRLSLHAQQNPRATAFFTAGGMGSFGDAAAQKIEHRNDEDPKEIDLRRVFAMGSFCSLCASVVYVPFYQYLDRVFGAGRTMKQVVQKTAVNQLLLSPFFDLPVYFAWSGYIDGLTREQSVDRFKLQYKDTLFGTWAVWVPVCTFNFRYVPLHLRVPVAYTGEAVWAMTISWLSHRPSPIEEQPSTQCTNSSRG
jgi:hypothetical protein